MAIELIFRMAIVNSHLIYKENYSTSNMIILQFRESFVRSLLLSRSFEDLKPGARQRSTSQSKRNLADHKLDEKEGSAYDVRRCCAGCHEKFSQKQPREVGHAAAKKVKTFCPDCDKFFCLDCFNQKHRTF